MTRKFPFSCKVLLLFGDMGIILFSTPIVIYLKKFFDDTSSLPHDTYSNMAPIILLLAFILFNVNGLFSLARKLYSEVFMSIFVAQTQLLVAIMAASFFFREFSYSRSVLIIATLLQLFALAFWNYLFWKMGRKFIVPKKALLIGSQKSCERILTRIQTERYLSYTVDYISTNSNVDAWENIIGNIDLLILCDGISLEKKAAIMNYAHSNNKQVFIIPSAYELYCRGADIDKMDDIPVFRAKYLKPTMEQRFLKRALDLIITIPSILILLPLFALIAILIKIDSKGPIFYKQIRVGRNENLFTILKFRTMKNNAESQTGPVLASENDSRITKLGSFLRASRLDELPQFFNILAGDMSLVGPRPERPFFVEQFKKEIPEYIYRHNIKPGVTGMAQIHGKYNSTVHDKLIYDLIYIQRSNLIEDLRIILQTVKVLVNMQRSLTLNNDFAIIEDDSFEQTGLQQVKTNK